MLVLAFLFLLSFFFDCVLFGFCKKAAKLIDELNAKIPDDPDVLRAEYIVRALSAENKK